MLPGLHPWGRQWPVDTRDPVNRRHFLNRGRLVWLLTLPHLAGGKLWYDIMGKYQGVLTSLTGATAGWKGTTRPGGWGHVFLDGTGYLPVSDPGDALASDYVTVSAWVKASDAFGGFGAVINRRTAGNAMGWTMQNNGGNLQFFVGATLGNTSTSTGATTANVWYRVVGIYDGVAVRTYLNGQAFGFSALAGGVLLRPASSLVSIGRNEAATGNLFGGAVDDVSVWGRALSATEVKSDYTLSRLGYPGVLNRTGPPPATGGGSVTVAMTRRHGVSRGDGTVNTQNHVGRR